MVQVSAHMHVSPSIGVKNAYVKRVCVGRMEDQLQAVRGLSQHAGMHPVIRCQDGMEEHSAEGM